jgi:tetratricopeptide (TPR) repeat protein
MRIFVSAASRRAVLLIGLMFPAACLGAAAERVMERVDIRKSDTTGVAEIEFNQPVAIAAHCPATPGVFCEIELQLTLSTPGTGAVPDIHETISPSRRESFPLARLDYSQSSERRGVLALSFDIPVTLSVASAPNGRSLIVTYEAPSLAVAPGAKKTAQKSSDVRIVTLKESANPLNPNAEKTILPAMRYDMYTSTASAGGKTRHRLHLGFFTGEEDAHRALEAAAADYPDARIEKLPAADLDRAQTWFGSRKRVPSQQGQSAPDGKNERLMERARQALITGDNPTAIRAYSSVVQSNDPEYLASALEYLGVARERNNQLAHAKAEYEEFLRRYPEGEASARVRQRLEGLLTARMAPKEALKDTGMATPRNRWDVYGSLTQFYRGQESKFGAGTESTYDSALDTTFNVTARQRAEAYNLRTEFSGSHYKPLAGPDDASKGRIYTLSAEATQKQGEYSVKAGRQSVHSGGIYGRFDGVHYTRRLTGQDSLGVTAGYLVDYSVTNSLNRDRRFAGAQYGMASRDKVWNTRLYAVEQSNHGLTDRRAVGADTQYFKDGNSLYAIADYDVYFRALNQATLMTTWLLPGKSSVGLTADYRKSPLLTVNNAVIGQAATLAGLKSLYSENQLKQLALDRTTGYRAFSLSYSQPAGERFQFSADLSASRFGGTPASGGVDATPEQGTEYYFSAQVVGNNLFAQEDISIAGLRFSDSDTSTATTLSLSSRLPIRPSWRFNPKLVLELRDNSNGSERKMARTSMIIDYRVRKSLLMQIEANYDRSQTKTGGVTDEQSITYVYAGYIFDF